MEDVIREKDKGVSAIVGTILIVAITVVLAATVYGVLTGFGGLIGGCAPSGAIQVTTSGTHYSVSFNSLGKNVSLGNVEVKITNSAGTVVVSPALKNAAVVTAGSFSIEQNDSSSTTLLTISSTIDVWGGGAVSQIAIIDTSPSGTIATWSSS